MKNINNRIVFKAIMAREAARAKTAAFKARVLDTTKARVLDTTGEGYVDTAIKIIIAVVIGGLLLAGLVLLFNNVIMPRVNDEVTDLFDAAG